jgi:DNA polymerase III epsilon subunit-like protein
MQTKHTLIFCDTETTGASTIDRICQVAFAVEKDTVYSDVCEELILPPSESVMTIEAMTVHHITTKMLEGSLSFEDSRLGKELLAYSKNPFCVGVAHNAPFDSDMLKKDKVIFPFWIDTLRVARQLLPFSPKHNLQYLRYSLDLDKDLAFGEVINPHDAKSDVIILILLYKHLVQLMCETNLELSQNPDALIEKMIELTKLPITVELFSFGKYKGEKIIDVAQKDRGYLQWLLGEKLKTSPDDLDWIVTLENALK